MTIDEGVKNILEIEEETGLYIPVCWSKEGVEDRLERSISEDDWRSATRLVDKYSDFSLEVIEAIETALEEI